jgi:hypothetical protein
LVVPAAPLGSVAVSATTLESETTPGLYFIGHLAADAVLLTSGLGGSWS